MNQENFLDEIRCKAIEDLKVDGRLRPKAVFYPLRRPPIFLELDLGRKDHTMEVINIINQGEDPSFMITLMDTRVRKVDGVIEHPKNLADELARFESLRDDPDALLAISLMMISKGGKIISQIIPYEKGEKGYDFDYGSQCELEFEEPDKGIGLNRW
jgi:hypothetical protein